MLISLVCGIVRTWNPGDDEDKKNVIVSEAIPIAGHWTQNSGHPLEYKWHRLKSMDSSQDGLQLELWGKKYGGLMQKAVINFECDATRTGNDKPDKDDKDKSRRDKEDDEDDDDEEKDEDEDKDEDDDKKSDRDLQFVSYGPVDTKDGIMKVLRLNWKTKYACEAYEGGKGDASSSWGLFTWFILM
jgi:autophagy-related protein 27